MEEKIKELSDRLSDLERRLDREHTLITEAILYITKELHREVGKRYLYTDVVSILGA